MMDTVVCYSGSIYAEKPRSFCWQGQNCRVARILAQWCTPQLLCFRVCSEDGRIFDLQYHEQLDDWQVQFTSRLEYAASFGVGLNKTRSNK